MNEESNANVYRDTRIAGESRVDSEKIIRIYNDCDRTFRPARNVDEKIGWLVLVAVNTNYAVCYERMVWTAIRPM